jgi:hypothetical protein
MSSNTLRKAIELIKAGKKLEAQRLLEPLLKTDPSNVSLWLWYVETCSTVEQRICALERCLYSNPDNEQIKQTLAMFKTQQSAEPSLTYSTVQLRPSTEKRGPKSEITSQADILKSTVTSSQSQVARSTRTKPQTNAPPKSAFVTVLVRAIGILAILALIVSQLWLFYRVDKLEKALAVAQLGIETNRSDIRSLARGLDYVTPLAENANRYAHAHNTWSDARLKMDIVNIPDPLNNVLALNGIRFNWNTKDFPEMGLDNNPQFGFIAQDVELVYPEIVTTDANGYKMVDYSKLIPILVEAIKEQQAMIESLKEQVLYLGKNR